MKTTLYELTQEYIEAMDFLTDPENEIEYQTIADTFEGIDYTIEQKITSTAKVITMLKNLAGDIEEVEKKQRERRKSIESRVENLKNYLIGSMQATGKDKVETPEILVKLAKKPASVAIVDESLIPEQFWRVKEVRDINKTDIKNAGGCPGAEIITDAYRLAIK